MPGGRGFLKNKHFSAIRPRATGKNVPYFLSTNKEGTFFGPELS